jgi:hypothetical protein
MGRCWHRIFHTNPTVVDCICTYSMYSLRSAALADDVHNRFLLVFSVLPHFRPSVSSCYVDRVKREACPEGSLFAGQA